MAKERKAKRQKNFDIIQEATKLWETLRQSTTAKAKKVELVGSILEICGDRVGDLAASHTASRIIQSCVKHGNGNHRVCVQEQVLPKIVELAKNPYGRFIVSKLIATAPKDQLPGMISFFFITTGALVLCILAVDRTNCVIFPTFEMKTIYIC